jgi:UPF0176 protein
MPRAHFISGVSDQTFKIAAFYKFVSLPDCRDLRERWEGELRQLRVLGTLLVAEEGVNGTLAGDPPDLDRAIDLLQSDPRLRDLEAKISWAQKMPFHRLKVQKRREIVTLGQPDADPNRRVGEYVGPADWNALISDPDVVLVDTRNDYEVETGTFEGALNPKTENFRQFPDYVRENLDPQKHKKVAMFCTGGIRCEKATAHLLNQGFEHVYHLQGGILNYLEQVPPEQSKWRGDCFVFDNRVTVNHALRRGDFTICGGCQRPVPAQEREHPDFEEGVSCHRCRSNLTEDRIERLRMRRKQFELARQKNQHYYAQPDQVRKFQPTEFDEGPANDQPRT